MARIIQVLLPLVAAALVKAQLPHIPFFDNIPGLHHPPRPISDNRRDNRITHNNVGYNGGYDTWFHHFGNPDVHQFSSENHQSYDNPDPFFDPYFQGNRWDQMPGIHNVFNIPNPGYNSHRHKPPHTGNNPQEKPKQDHNGEPNAQKPEEKPKEIPSIDKNPTEQDKGPKLNEVSTSDANNKINEANTSDVENKLQESKIPDPITNGELLPPKTNAIKKEVDNGEGNKGDKQVDVDKKKDYLLVGQDNNGNKLYLLHENNPNPTTVITPNGNQAGNNIIYIPYNPGQGNNQVYQVVNGQAAPSNIKMSPDKMGVPNGYNNALPNPGQSTTNLNAGSQNPGYVTIYSNGQLLQIPGVVVNSAPNNVPVQNGNQVQGANYIIANAVPNNVQSVPAVQNPGTNVIYATIPNQGSNGPIYVQVPNCMNTMSNGCGSGATVQNAGVNNGMTNNGLPSNVIIYQANPNTVAQPALSNGYIQPDMAANQAQGAITVAIPNNQNVQYQPAVQFPVSSGSNGYNQPIVSNLGQGQNVPNQKEKQNVPFQPMISTNQGNQPTYQPVQVPVNSGTNWYNQPIVSTQAQGPTAPIQGTTVNNQNTPEQSGVVIPIPSGYDHPLITNPIVNVETRGDISSNQNGAQPVVSVTGDTNDQGANALVNSPSKTESINHESDISQPLATSTLVLDSNNLSALGAQPAIMIADFKEKSGDDKDKKKSKDKKEKKDKGKKKDKKPKDDDKPKDSEPFTNNNI